MYYDNRRVDAQEADALLPVVEQVAADAPEHHEGDVGLKQA